MAQRSPETVILGAGPVGLVTALFAARRGPVLVVLPRGTATAGPSRIDSVPVSLLALLLEIGVHPAEIAVESVYDNRLVAWGTADPTIVRGAATIHIERPSLEMSLLALAHRHRSIRFVSGLDIAHLPPASNVLDATGRRAVSANQRFVPSNPALCRAFVLRGEFSIAQQSFRMASLPTGYAYRMGNHRMMMIALVQGRLQWIASTRSLINELTHFNADWLLAGLPRSWAAERSRGGAASVQWACGDSPIHRIGDAAIARDALASQGIANGISSGIRAVEEPKAYALRNSGERAELTLHLGELQKLIYECRWKDCAYWSQYSQYISAFSTQMAKFKCITQIPKSYKRSESRGLP
ncbi:hypothetical protein FJ420_06930 [Mesorhizobium sp. B3-1-3]|uniref:hypothetical protein n=1 Tax=unclassified Mesorhizobium TaxID=325217 RepID=UPI00112BDF78|nr:MULTISPECIES: hypothetical protein [unclassified Mesorhizobium]TPI62537.1 hypothetical protein FJ424_20405 [Mesorhizobium sp. B3-1-8]TPI74106.1 hypothetical protein FJ420_06930 [Mesorhizobium sp. B3-1-3]